MTMSPEVAPPIPPQEADAAAVDRPPFAYTGNRYSQYWNGVGVPTTRQLQKLENSRIDLSTGEYGANLRNIAGGALEVPLKTGETAVAPLYGDDFVDKARQFKSAKDEEEKITIAASVLDEFERNNEMLSDEAREEAGMNVLNDLRWASQLKDTKDGDALETLDTAITDYRAIGERVELARELYAEAHGKTFKRSAAALRRVKQGIGGFGLGDVIATTTGRVAAHMYAREKPLDPEKMSKVRRTARTGAALLLLAGTTYLKARGWSDVHVDDGGAAAHAVVDTTPDNLGDVAADAAKATHDANESVQSASLPTETHELGVFHKDAAGHLDGTAWEAAREYADKHGIEDDLTKDEFTKAVDNILNHNDVGGKDASHAERWEAASSLSADDELTIGAEDFKGMVPDGASVAAPEIDPVEAPADSQNASEVNHPAPAGDTNVDPVDQAAKENTAADTHQDVHFARIAAKTALVIGGGLPVLAAAGVGFHRLGEKRRANDEQQKQDKTDSEHKAEDEAELSSDRPITPKQARDYLIALKLKPNYVKKLSDDEAIEEAREYLRTLNS